MTIKEKTRKYLYNCTRYIWRLRIEKRLEWSTHIFTYLDISGNYQRIDKRLELSTGNIGTYRATIYSLSFCCHVLLWPAFIIVSSFTILNHVPHGLPFGKPTTSYRRFLWPDSISKPLSLLLRYQISPTKESAYLLIIDLLVMITLN